MIDFFFKAMEERKDNQKFNISQANVKNIMSVFKSNASKFGWSFLVQIVPFESAEETKSIIKYYTSVTIKQVKKQVRSTWGDRAAGFDDELPEKNDITSIDSVSKVVDCVHFYCIIRATIVAKRIEGLFDETSIKTLFNKKREFTWNDPLTDIKELDGPKSLFKELILLLVLEFQIIR